ncbi:glycerophosphodiester phosphodiesterase [Aquisphaera insulae]|uniref:glycerophosphodiester phosphodiesterase n=1 Tax=Aquisphaera insulae TaxID=2712864 RepID=UPI0013EC9CC5|nr:glycerophosphodiester phosphodiesterase family protein [Aquisphaera insulae]
MNNPFLELLSESRQPAVIAHRGCSCLAPENTLEAARLAHACGAAAWELDVQLTRDGVPVVLHDEFLVRTTDVARRFEGDARGSGGFRLSDFDRDEVASLDAGSWFVQRSGGRRTAVAFGTLERIEADRRAFFESGRIRIPTLVEALALTSELDWLVNVELKSFPESPPGLVEAVVEAIRRTGTEGRVLLSSFDHRDVARLVHMAAGGTCPPRGILVDTPLFRPAEYIRDIVGAQTFHASADCLGAGSIAYRRSPSAASLCGAEVAELRRASIPTLVYTVNDSRQGGLAEHLAAIGVAAIITDDPGAVSERINGRLSDPEAS